MKLTLFFALLTLIMMVKGAWWAAAVQPIILSLGAIFTAFDSDIIESFVSKQDEEQRYYKPIEEYYKPKKEK